MIFIFFWLRFLSAICLPLQDYQCFEGQKLFHYKSTATFPSCNSFERSLLGACCLLPFAKHQWSRPGGSSGCRAFWRAQPARFTSPRRNNGTQGCVGRHSSAARVTQRVFRGSSLGPLAHVRLWMPKQGGHSIDVPLPKDMLSPLSLNKN